MYDGQTDVNNRQDNANEFFSADTSVPSPRILFIFNIQYKYLYNQSISTSDLILEKAYLDNAYGSRRTSSLVILF